jgi:hypothetical protein
MKFTIRPDKTVIADDIAQITFGELVPVQGGSHNAMLLADNQHITVQLPKCKVKSGVVRTSKKQYCDLEFELEAHMMVTDWMESLEEHCIDMLSEKRGDWFGSGTTAEDIEDSMVSNVKVNSDGKTFVIRVDIGGGSGMKIQYGDPCAVYDVTGSPRTLEDIKSGSSVIPLIALRHVKIANTFTINIQMTQLMLVEEQVCVVEKVVQEIEPAIENQDPSDVDEPLETESEVTAPDSEVTALESEVPAPDSEVTALESEVTAPDSEVDGGQTNDVNLDSLLGGTDDIGNADSAQVVNLDVADITETSPLQLLEPKDVRIKLYKEARQRAISARKKAIEEIMRARDIKMEFMLDDYVDSESDMDSDMESVYGDDQVYEE